MGRLTSSRSLIDQIEKLAIKRLRYVCRRDPRLLTFAAKWIFSSL